MRSGTIAAAIAGLAVAGGAANAQAATVAVDAGCYLSGSTVTASGTGFTANGPVNFAFDGQVSGSGVADPAGNITSPLTAPILPSGSFQHTYSLAAQDQSNPALAATVPVNVTARVATVVPHRARPRRRVKFGIHGLIPGKPVYLHYVFHGRQRYVRKLGTAKAPCGSLTARRRFFPVNRPKVGTWTFQLDNRHRYSKSTQPRIRGPVTIFNVLKSSAASAF
ncbi:MAG TPA: hypothetical protein VF032_13470 [Thermoleophilaceae bacterium]